MIENTYEEYRRLIDRAEKAMIKEFGNGALLDKAWASLRYKWGVNGEQPTGLKLSRPRNKVTYEEYKLTLQMLDDKNLYTEYIMIFLLSELDVEPFSILGDNERDGVKKKDIDKIGEDYYLTVNARYERSEIIKLPDYILKELSNYIEYTKDKRKGHDYIVINSHGKPLSKAAFWATAWKTNILFNAKKEGCIARNKNIVPWSFKGAAIRNNGTKNLESLTRIA